MSLCRAWDQPRTPRSLNRIWFICCVSFGPRGHFLLKMRSWAAHWVDPDTPWSKRSLIYSRSTRTQTKSECRRPVISYMCFVSDRQRWALYEVHLLRGIGGTETTLLSDMTSSVFDGQNGPLTKAPSHWLHPVVSCLWKALMGLWEGYQHGPLMLTLNGSIQSQLRLEKKIHDIQHE